MSGIPDSLPVRIHTATSGNHGDVSTHSPSRVSDVLMPVRVKAIFLRASTGDLYGATLPPRHAVVFSQVTNQNQQHTTSGIVITSLTGTPSTCVTLGPHDSRGESAMVRRLIFILFITVASGCGGGGGGQNNESSNPPPTQPETSILWIGAHPDDEYYVAPYLGEHCVAQNANCKLIVVTQGERGSCKLPDGCHPDVATVRILEMQNAAAHLDAELVLENWGDGTADSTAGVLEQWASLFDGADAMVDWMANEISSFKPDLILTFDPRHGTSCHKDHTAIGNLAYMAAKQIGYDLSKLYLLEHDMQVFNFSSLVAAPLVEDDLIEVIDVSGFGWSFLADHVLLYPSQFDSLTYDFIVAADERFQKNYFLKASDIMPGDQRYLDLCPDDYFQFQ